MALPLPKGSWGREEKGWTAGWTYISLEGDQAGGEMENKMTLKAEDQRRTTGRVRMLSINYFLEFERGRSMFSTIPFLNSV